MRGIPPLAILVTSVGLGFAAGQAGDHVIRVTSFTPAMAAPAGSASARADHSAGTASGAPSARPQRGTSRFSARVTGALRSIQAA